MKLIEEIYDNLEQILNLKTRGCDGINSRTDKLKGKIQCLVQMLDRLDCEVRIEMDKSESSYEQELRS
uniref:Uncharacterized protein n=1 Tax=Romanomermis culicivorax TaxID=13658 RepID=A0A915HHV0_ROMCU